MDSIHLNEDEKHYIKGILSMNRYDAVWMELSCFVPCAILVVLGMINDSYAALGSGLLVYFLFQMRNHFSQARHLSTLQSIFLKLKETQESSTRP